MTQVRVPPTPRTIGTLAGVPVQVDPIAPVGAIGVWGMGWVLVGRRYPRRSVALRALLTCLWAGLFFSVFFLHSLGHIVSARAAGAPMDALVITAVHWLTRYYNSGVPPQAHLGRAAGGPLANLAGLLIGHGLRRVLPAGPLGRDLAEAFLAFDAVVGAAALLPTPSFDGGALLKWSVYAATGSFPRAGRVVQAAGLGASGVLGALGLGALLSGRRWTGLVLAASSLIAALESTRRD
jgi:Zn-dependent protease